MSIDRGRSWVLAHMVDGEKWYVIVNVINPLKSCVDNALSVGEGAGEDRDSVEGETGTMDFVVEDEVTHVKRWLVKRSVAIWARAVDDSGWIEGCCDSNSDSNNSNSNSGGDNSIMNKVNIVVVY